MMALLLLLVLGGGGDAAFLDARVKELTLRYEQLAARQTPEAVRERATVVREIGHLPFGDGTRQRAARLLARIVSEDRAYRVRAFAARAIGRVGTRDALDAMVVSLFGDDGRSARFDLLYTVLPEALGSLRDPDDLDWIAETILRPAAASGGKAVRKEAGPLQRELLTLTLEGIVRAQAATLAPSILQLARAEDPIVRAAAVEALACLGISDPAIEAALREPDEGLRAAAALSPTLGADDLRRALEDTAPRVRAAAIRGLRARPPRPESVALLIERLGAEGEDRIRLDVADALEELTGKDFGLDPDLWRSWWALARADWSGPSDPEPGERAYFFDLGLRTRRVTFVIDASASMATADDAGVSRLAYAARELERAVKGLPAGARFRLLVFSGDCRGWPPETDPGGDRTMAGPAAAVLLAQKPGGGTNTYGALMTALDDSFRPDSIVLLTDGVPYRCAYRGKTYAEPEQILAEVAHANAERGVRIDAVALRTGLEKEPADAEAAVDFLRRLAARNRGEFREVR